MVLTRANEGIEECLDCLRSLDGVPGEVEISLLLTQSPKFLEVFRLLLNAHREHLASTVCGQLGESNVSWENLVELAVRKPVDIALAFVRLHLPEAIDAQIDRDWSLADILAERAKALRAHVVEDATAVLPIDEAIERSLKSIEVPFKANVYFKGRRRKTAPCDFAIPAIDHPKVVIATAAFREVSDEWEEYLARLDRINKARDFHTYLFVVVDGVQWMAQEPKLKRLIKLQNDGDIDLLYTRQDLLRLLYDVKHIHKYE